MIERSEQGWNIICDGAKCGEFLEIESPDHDFDDVTTEMRAQGWRSVKDVDNEWHHICPCCREEFDGQKQKA